MFSFYKNPKVDLKNLHIKTLTEKNNTIVGMFNETFKKNKF